MSRGEKVERAPLLYGWCMTGDHDQPDERGGCPVRVGSMEPCACGCHEGVSEARGMLAGRSRGQAAEASFEPVGAGG